MSCFLQLLVTSCDKLTIETNHTITSTYKTTKKVITFIGHRQSGRYPTSIPCCIIYITSTNMA